MTTLLAALLALAQFFNDAKVPMRDGVNLAADVYLPSNRAEKVGCFLQFSPYKATKSDKPWFVSRAEEWGVATVSVDCRGLCHSEGVFEPFESRLTDDAYDLLDWISRQPWSNGKVVMVGGSYPGNTQLACMRSGHPALVACSPSVITFNAYTINFANGVNVPQFFRGWHSSLAGTNSWLELTRHPDPNDDYWKSRNSLRELRATKSRAFYQAGWFDMLGIDTFETFNAMPAGSFLRIGPWSHGVNTFDKPEVDYSKRGGAVTEDLELDFLRSALEGRAPETAKLPGRILMYVMGRNVWRYENEWPLARTQYRKLYLDANRTLGFAAGAAGEDLLVYDPENPVPTRGGRIIHAGGQYDQSEVERHPDVLCFTGPVLAEDLEVTGAVRARVRAISSAPVADVAVKLVDVTPDGKPYCVLDGICRGRFEADRPTTLDFRVDITSYVFLKGHRVRVEIAGSNSPHFEKAPTAARTRILRGADGTYLTLPVIPTSN